MADISELILEVKNANSAVHEIDKVDQKLKQTTKSANELKTIGKTLFAGWSFTKLIGAAKAFGDAWRNTLVTTRKFDAVFGSFNRNAQAGVKELTEKFHDTERGAKDLIATIGSRLDFGFDTGTLGKVSSDLARISKELSSFYPGKNATDVSLKLTQALAGQTRGLKEYGINIDINSKKFKELVKSIQESTNETEEGAKALAVYSKIMDSIRNKEGTFETQAKTLSQLLEDIKNSFVDGPLAQAGKILSDLLGPVLTAINYLLQSPIGQALGGLITTIISLTAALNLLKIVANGLLTLTGVGGILSKIGPTLKENFLKTINLLTLFKWKMVRHDVSLGLVIQRIGKNVFKGTFNIFLKLGSIISAGLGRLFIGINKQLGLSLLRLGGALEKQLIAFSALLAGAPIKGIGLAFKAIGVAILAALVLIVDGFYGFNLFKKLWAWFKDFTYKLTNAIMRMFRGQDARWETEAERQAKNLQIYKERTEKIKENVDKVNQKAQEALDELFESDKVFLPENVEELIKEGKEKISSLRLSLAEALTLREDLTKAQEEYDRWLEENKKYVELGNSRYKQLVDLVKQGTKLDSTTDSEILKAVQAAVDNDFKLSILAEKRIKNSKLIESKTKALLAQQKENSRLEENLLKDRTSKFEIYSWYKNSIEKITTSLKEMTPIEKIKSIQERIDKFKQLYSTVLLNPEEARAKYKELGDMEIQKFEAEMEALNTEREFIQETNEMIKNYVDQALQWKAQGVEGIQAGTAEGYKFITSGFSNLSNLGPILKEQESSQKSLQEKANSIAERSSEILEGIKTKIDAIDPNAGRINFNLVYK